MDGSKTIMKMNKLAGVMEMAISLNKLDNSDNLKDGKPSNVLLRHHTTSSEEFTNFEPVLPQYKNFKDVKFTSHNLRIIKQKSNGITVGLGVTIVLHVR